MSFFMLVDSITNLPLRLKANVENRGFDWNDDHQVVCQLEQSNERNDNLPVWTTTNFEQAHKVALDAKNYAKDKAENIDDPNMGIFTEGEIVVKQLTILEK